MLTFSSIDNPEVPYLLSILKIDQSQIKEVVGRTSIEYIIDDSVKYTNPILIWLDIANKLFDSDKSDKNQDKQHNDSNQYSSLLGKSPMERLQVEQWLSYAYNIISPELKNTRDTTFIWETLHHELVGKTFIAGTQNASLADHVLYALLRGRINNFLPSNCTTFYRVVRWALLQSDSSSQFKCNDINLKSLQAALNQIEEASTSSSSKKTLKSSKNSKQNQSKKSSDPSTSTHPHTLPSHSENENENANLPLISRLDLKIGRIVQVEKHPNADRLFIETVDFGNEIKKTVVSGLIGHVTREELLNRLALFICNLKPAKICGTLSEAMLLAAKSDDGSIVEPLLVPLSASEGDVVSVMDLPSNPDSIITPIKSSSSNSSSANTNSGKENSKKVELDAWAQCKQQLSIKDGNAFWNDKPLKIIDKEGNFTSTRVNQGIIS